ncbi:hypothetical protein JXA05_04410 [Candidatus Peregrinibacteria bacterium]|nr:hypothetical protein [Candidatus Peregrinibacteria bacterium]
MKICKQCATGFEVRDADRRFYETVGVSEPQMCPDCRMQRRMMFRNFFNLYHRKCDLTGKQIVSMYDVDAPFPVYEMYEWWSDKWDGLSYGIDVDLNRPVFDQLKILHRAVPRMNISNINCENTDYCNFSFSSRNCYLVFGNVGNEDCVYGHIVWQSKDCYDCLYTYASRFCYECADCFQCHSLSFSVNCDNCSEGRFLHNCVGCRDCFGCVGLKDKQFHIFNKSYSKTDYEAKIREFNSGNIQLVGIAQKKLQELIGQEIVKYYHGYNCENVTGDYLYNCKNVFRSFDLKNCEDCAYSATLDRFINSYDCNFSAPPSEWCVNCLTCTGQNMKMCHSCLHSADMAYCDFCMNCKDCFGCAGLKNKQYCVFNKQYSKGEYEKLTARLVVHMKAMGEWGEFFPADFSPFAYNETIASEYYPLSKLAAGKQGLRWKEKNEEKNYKGPKYQIPDDIKDVPDNICKQILLSEKSAMPYKIIPQELKFYRENHISIPRLTPDERHWERLKKRNPRILWDRKCDNCGKAIKTTYSPDRPEKVYCEACYLNAVY